MNEWEKMRKWDIKKVFCIYTLVYTCTVYIGRFKKKKKISHIYNINIIIIIIKNEFLKWIIEMNFLKWIIILLQFFLFQIKKEKKNIIDNNIFLMFGVCIFEIITKK